MGGDELRPEQNEPEKRRFIDRISLKNLGRVAVVAALAVTAGFGGLNKGEAATPVAMDETYDNGVLRLTPHRLDAICHVEQLRSGGSSYQIEGALKESKQVIALNITVENIDDKTVRLGSGHKSQSAPDNEIFTLVDATEYEYLGAVRPTGRYGNMFEIAPGKNINLTLYWVVPLDKWATPGIATVRMYDVQWQEGVRGRVELAHTRPIARFGNVSSPVRRCS